MHAVSNDTTQPGRKRKKTSKYPAPPETKKVDFDYEESLLQQPVWHVIALNILTVFGYSLFWFYKTWKDLRANSLGDCSPILRTLGVIIPIWQMYLVFDLFNRITLLAPTIPTKRKTAVAIALTVSLWALLAMAALPGAWFFLHLTATIPIAIAQRLLNDYWRTVEKPGLIVRHAFSPMELLAIVIGAMLLGLCIASFILIPGR